MSSSWFGGVIGRLWSADGENDSSSDESPGERELTPTKYRLSKVSGSYDFLASSNHSELPSHQSFKSTSSLDRITWNDVPEPKTIEEKKKTSKSHDTLLMSDGKTEKSAKPLFLPEIKKKAESMQNVREESLKDALCPKEAVEERIESDSDLDGDGWETEDSEQNNEETDHRLSYTNSEAEREIEILYAKKIYQDIDEVVSLDSDGKGGYAPVARLCSEDQLFSAEANPLAPVYSSVNKWAPLKLESTAHPGQPPDLPTPDWPGAPKLLKVKFIDPDRLKARSLEKQKRNAKKNPHIARMEKQWNSVKKLWGSVNQLAKPAANNIKKRIASKTRPISLIIEDEQGQTGFEEFRRYVKQGGDFCKELAAILQERSEAEIQYSKTLAKLSTKLTRATKDNQGTVCSCWHKVGQEMEVQSEIHKSLASSLSEEVVKPLRQLLESQHRIRKSVETAVDKSNKNLTEWRAAESKAKKNSFSCSRENEKLRDGTNNGDSNGGMRTRLSTSSIHISDKDTAKMESKRRKAEECVKKADVEYYSVCLRAERSRLEWESAVIRGSQCFQVMEEERLKGLKDLATTLITSFNQIGPKLAQMGERMKEPLDQINLAEDMATVTALRIATQPPQEQLLPDFYPEQISLAMNRDRRKQALIKLLQLIRADLERERRGKAGVENLARALKRTPNFADGDSQQNVMFKLHHIRSMLTYLEAARFKVQRSLAELEGNPVSDHPLAEHLYVSKDRQGFRQTVLKVPPWVHNDSMDLASDCSDWVDRGTADGNSVQPDSDFDEFSSQGSEDIKDYDLNGTPAPGRVVAVPPTIIPQSAPSPLGTAPAPLGTAPPPLGTVPSPLQAAPAPQRCKALYSYTANLYDELSLNPGDIIEIHDKQPDGWWLGELNGTVGIFPATYVEELTF
ncbi:Variant SH3 domain [Nesidiocoris tenuis]|uniref:Variant SH3 domain n=1 Tax=Nesidiocoris tenuis TaxID=355587 RepID=A0ABN7B9V4_9HEMI|nr:Variant SH3 domain [Nesidiocoris tenuis]